MTGMAVTATVAMGAAFFATPGAALADTATVSFNNFCTASSIVTVTKTVATSVSIDAPATVQPGQTFTYRVQPAAGSYPNSDSGATTTNISRLKVDYAVPANATFVSAAVVAGTSVGLDNVAPDVQRVNDSGSPDAAGAVIRLSGGNQVIGNGTSNSTNSEGGIRVPKTKKNLDGSTNSNGDTWYRLPAVDVTVTAGASGTIQPTVRVAGAAGNNNANENWSTQLAKASLLGTQWAPTKCSPRDSASAGLNAGGGALTTINIGSSTPVDQDTTTTLNVPATAETGASVNLSATVAPNPGGGTVQFKDNDTDIGSPIDAASGTASLPHTFNAAGAHQITAVFSGATGFTGSTSAASTITVSDPAPTDQDTTTTLTAPSTATSGTAVNLTATVAPDPAGGTVQFKKNGTDIGTPVAVNGGSATLSYTFTDAGPQQITAVFSGATGFTGSTSAASTITVSDPAPTDQDTTTTLTAPSTANKGTAVELKAVVTPNPGGGTVQFKDNGTAIGAPVNVVNGEATLSHTFTDEGDHHITAEFLGVTGFTGSSSTPSTVTVGGDTTTTTTTSTTSTTTTTNPGHSGGSLANIFGS